MGRFMHHDKNSKWSNAAGPRRLSLPDINEPLKLNYNPEPTQQKSLNSMPINQPPSFAPANFATISTRRASSVIED